MDSILFVESENQQSPRMRRFLVRAGYDVEVRLTQVSALESTIERSFSLILIDLDQVSERRPSTGSRFLDEKRWDGVDLVCSLRKKNLTTPIILHSNFDDEDSERIALDLGADALISKKSPFAVQTARLKAHLTRQLRDMGTNRTTSRNIRLGQFTLDRRNRLLIGDDAVLVLAVRELKFLELLAANPFHIVPVEEILCAISTGRPSTVAALASLIRRLRLKMNRRGFPNPVENHRSEGFQLSSSFILSELPERHEDALNL